MKIAISQITTLPTPLEEDLPAFAAAGFEAVELSIEKANKFVAANSVGALKALLDQHGLKATGAIGLAPDGPALLLSQGHGLDDYLASLRSQLALCQALGCRVLGIGADAGRWLTDPSWRKSAAGNLRKAGALAADHGVTIAVESLSLGPPIGPFVLETLRDTLALVREAGHPALGLSLDFFHHFRSGGTAEEFAALEGTLIADVHVTDVVGLPKESLDDGDRVLPGEGVAPIAAYRDAILSTGYDGYWTLELLNKELWALDVSEAARLSRRGMQGFVGGGR